MLTLHLCFPEEKYLLYGMENPLPRNEIQGQDFEGRKNQLLYQKKEEKKHSDLLSRKIRSYEENLTALAEYSELIPTEMEEREQVPETLSAEELRNYKGILVRDYNQKIRDTRQQKELLVQFLNRIVRMESFQDDFYRKPLEQLLELSDNGTQVLTQLKTTVQSYGKTGSGYFSSGKGKSKDRRAYGRLYPGNP